MVDIIGNIMFYVWSTFGIVVGLCFIVLAIDHTRKLLEREEK